MKRKITFLIMLVVTLSGSLGSAAVKVGDEAPVFEATTLTGQRINSADLKHNNPMLIVFWASWCPYCVRDVQKLNNLYESYHPKGLVMVAINPGVNDSVRKIEQFIKNHGATYPIVFDNGAAITRKFGVFGAPTYFVVDKSGFIRFRGNELPSSIEQLIEMSLALR